MIPTFPSLSIRCMKYMENNVNPKNMFRALEYAVLTEKKGPEVYVGLLIYNSFFLFFRFVC